MMLKILLIDYYSQIQRKELIGMTFLIIVFLKTMTMLKLIMLFKLLVN